MPAVPTPGQMSSAPAVAAGAAANMRAQRPYSGRVPVSLDQLNVYNPNRADAIEAIFQPFYDFQPYLAAGQTQISFFQTGLAGRTLADTNMQLGGQFPSPTAFLCIAIMVLFIPQFPAGGPSGAVAKTAAAATVATNINDVNAVANSGWLNVTVGNKPYLNDAPIGKFPPNFSIGGLQDAAGTYAAGTQIIVDFARTIGRYYEITPLLIPMSQNFVISLNWPAAVAVTALSRIGVIMDGFYYRQSQ